MPEAALVSTPPGLRARRVGLAFACLLFAFLYGRYLVGFSPSGGDIVNQYLPYQHLIRNALRQGGPPYWNAFTFCGRPLMADIQIGVLYPPNWLHWLLPLPLSFALVLALHGAWMIAGCWLLGRHWRLRASAIALATVLFCASPFFSYKLARGVILFIYVGAWWPWLVLAVSRLAARPNFGRMAALAVALTFSLLAGSPQITFYGWIITLAVGLALPVAAGEAPAALRWLRRALWIGGAFAAALALAAPQIAQTYHFIANSFERGAGASWDYVTDGSLSPHLFWLLANPALLGIGFREGYYFGSSLDVGESCFYDPLWIAALLVPLGLVLWGRRPAPAPVASVDSVADDSSRLYARLTWLAVAGLVLGVALAPGRYSPVFKLFYDIVPGFNRFRVPARLMVFFMTGLAVLAALVYQAFLERGLARRSLGMLLVGGTAAALALLWITFAMQNVIEYTVNREYWAGMPPELRTAYTEAIGRHAFWVALRASIGVILAAAALWALNRPGGGRDVLSPDRVGLPAAGRASRRPHPLAR
ncbi:MAG: hypothetical protein M1457_01890 [bacterium]|nr:hypothetical protein [bacterium]